MSDPVTDYYNENPENEWNRLFATPYRQVEFEVVQHFLSKYLPDTGRVLDVGGGPGRYTIALARRGYRVTLADLSEKNIEFARKKIEAAGTMSMVEDCLIADARDLSVFDNKTFDAVLCMGPLYHFTELDNRLQCLRECARVMKTEAPLFITVLPRCTYIRDALRSGAFEDLIPDGLPALEEIFAQGTSSFSKIPNTYFCQPDEVETWLNETGFGLLELASSHGFAAFMDEKVNQLAKNAGTWNALIKLILASCTDPASFSAAEHLIGVARKHAVQS